MTEQKKYLPKWAADEIQQLKSKIEGLEIDNAKLRGEVTGDPWVFASSHDIRFIGDIPLLGSRRKKHRKIEVGSDGSSRRWQIELADDDRSIKVRSPWNGDGMMVVIPEASNTVSIAMVQR